MPCCRGIGERFELGRRRVFAAGGRCDVEGQHNTASNEAVQITDHVAVNQSRTELIQILQRNDETSVTAL